MGHRFVYMLIGGTAVLAVAIGWWVGRSTSPFKQPAYHNNVGTSTTYGKPPDVQAAPAHPDSIPGYKRGTLETHWTRVVSDVNGTHIRTLSVMENHCEAFIMSVRWRSVGDIPVRVRVVGGAAFDKATGRSVVNPGEEVGVGKSGLIITKNGCQQPEFFLAAPDMLADLVSESVIWEPTP